LNGIGLFGHRRKSHLSGEDAGKVSQYQSFEQHQVKIGDWRVHYVDTGVGPPVLMLHGSPVSSYTFGRQIAALSGRFRVVAPDLLNFGRSEGPGEGASFQQQAAMLCGLLDHLALGPFRLVGHDWGAPIGLGCAAGRPDEVCQLVLINTTILADFEPPGYWKPFILPGLGELLLVRLNLVARVLPLLMRSAQSPQVRQVYARPLQALGLRRTILALERLEGYQDLMGSVEAALPHFSQIPTLIVWGQPDLYFRRPALERLQELLPAADVCQVPGAGHFPQEDAPDAVTAALLDFLSPSADLGLERSGPNTL
jgi:haloalkane dehalogenase